MSRGFLATLAGLAMTLVAWYGPWEWPAAPALWIIHLTFGSDSNFADAEFRVKAVMMIALIVVNVGAWAVVARGLMALVGMRRGQSTGVAKS